MIIENIVEISITIELFKDIEDNIKILEELDFNEPSSPNAN